MSAKKHEIEALVEDLVGELLDSLMCEIDTDNEKNIEYAILYLEKVVQDIDYTDYID